MNKVKVFGAAIVVAVVFAFGGLGYIYVFSSFLGNEFYLNPVESAGIQPRHSMGCQEICFEGIFMGCQKSFQDLTCGFSCEGKMNVGSEVGELPVAGSTLCNFVDCVCS